MRHVKRWHEAFQAGRARRLSRWLTTQFNGCRQTRRRTFAVSETLTGRSCLSWRGDGQVVLLIVTMRGDYSRLCLYWKFHPNRNLISGTKQYRPAARSREEARSEPQTVGPATRDRNAPEKDSAIIDRMAPGIENQLRSRANDPGTLEYPRAGRGESSPRADTHHRTEEQHFISMRWFSSLR